MKYIVTVNEEFWEGGITNLYVTEAERASDAIRKVVKDLDDERFDSIDVEYSFVKYNESLNESIEQGYMTLQEAKEGLLHENSNYLNIEAFMIKEKELGVRLITTIS